MEEDEKLNPYGTGYVTKETVIKKSSTLKTDPYANRVIKISNPSKINPVSLSPIAYKLVPIASQGLLAKTDSWHHRRADFTDAPIWVTKYKDRELFPAGDYTNQSSGGEGIRSWVARDDNVENTDVVLWHTYTFTHNPRPEDFPIMRKSFWSFPVTSKLTHQLQSLSVSRSSLWAFSTITRQWTFLRPPRLSTSRPLTTPHFKWAQTRARIALSTVPPLFMPMASTCQMATGAAAAPRHRLLYSPSSASRPSNHSSSKLRTCMSCNLPSCDHPELR